MYLRKMLKLIVCLVFWSGLVTNSQIQAQYIDSMIVSDAGADLRDIRSSKVEMLEAPLSALTFGDSLDCRVVGGWFRGSNYEVFVVDTLAYMGDGRYLDILNVKSPESPVLVGRALTLSVVRDLYVSGGYTYIADEKGGLCIMDVSNPASPEVVGYCDTDRATGVYVVDPLAFVADGDAGLRLIDISNPAYPVEVGHYTSAPAWDVHISGDYAYIASWNKGLTIIDVSNPESPQEVAQCATGGYAYGIYVSGDSAYVADETKGLCIIEISNPQDPTWIGCHNLLSGYELDVYVSANYAYISTSLGELGIMDISNPENLVGSLDTEGRAFGIYVSGDYAYLADGNEGLRIISVSNPASPLEVGYYDTPGFAERVHVLGDYAYVTDYYDGGFRIIDISNPGSAEAVGCFDTEDNASGIDVSDSLVYLGTDGRFRIVNVSDPAYPEQIGYLDLRSEPSISDIVQNIYVSGDYAYVAARWLGFKVVKVSDPENPSLVGMAWPDASDVYVVGDYAYVAKYGWDNPNWSDGFKVIDVSDPEDLNLPVVGSLNTGNQTVSVHVSPERDCAYVTDLERGLITVGISDPENPEEFSFHDSKDRSEDVYVAGDYAHVADGNAGLRIIDVSKPMLPPTEVGYYETGGYANAVHVSGRYIYVADGHAGLYILESLVSCLSGHITQSQEWDSEILICGDVTVDSAVVLTINPGAVIRFMADSDDENSGVDTSKCELIIYGSLNISGTGAEEVKITSAGLQPKAGDWYGIRIMDGGEAKIQYATIEYGSCGLRLYSGSIDSVLNCHITNNEVYGIRCETHDAYICANMIDYNERYGIYVHNHSPDILDNVVANYSQSAPSYDIYCYFQTQTSSKIQGNELKGNPHGVGLYLYRSRPLVKECTIKNDSIGIVVFDSDPVITENTLSNNKIGLLCDCLADPTVKKSTIENSTLFGVYCTDNDNQPKPSNIMAEWNWWGTRPPDPNKFGGPVDYNPYSFFDCRPIRFIAASPENLPQEFSLSQNYPNPFNPITYIKYALPRNYYVSLEVYNILGQKVATLVDAEQKAGYKTARWDAGSLSSGIYFYRLQAGDFVQTRKMVVLK